MNESPEAGSSETELDLDLQLLPAWAQRPPTENQYSRFEGDSGDRSGRRSDSRSDRFGGRRPGGPPRGGPSRDGRPPQGQGHGQGHGGRGPRDASRGPARCPQRGGPDRGGPRHGERREPEAPPLELSISLVPEEKGVESLARQIRLTGRAYPLFDIAFLILKKPERYTVRLNVIKKPDGKVAVPLFQCGLDETLWLSEKEAIDHCLDKHFATFYQSERTPSDPPKGTYTFVAQCGMTGIVLGPPNYHDYQTKLRKLHAERFSRMPFEAFKARIKIVRDEEVVKKWTEDQSWKTEYTCLNVPEATKLANREEVEKHFREVHFPVVIKSVQEHTLSGPAAKALPSRTLQQALRRTWEDQMRFPIKIVTVLSHQLANHGMQFFKVRKTVTHVSVARPRFLDPEVTPVSESIIRIVEFIRKTPGCSRRKLLEALAPEVNLESAAAKHVETAPAAAPAPATDTAPATEPAATAEAAPNPQAAGVVADLHWLIYEGHVIEFSSGLIELAQKPVIKPTPERKAPAQKAPKQAGAAAAPDAAKAAQATAGPAPEAKVGGSEAAPVAPAAPIAPAPVVAEKVTEPAPAAAEPTQAPAAVKPTPAPVTPVAESAPAADASAPVAAPQSDVSSEPKAE